METSCRNSRCKSNCACKSKCSCTYCDRCNENALFKVKDSRENQGTVLPQGTVYFDSPEGSIRISVEEKSCCQTRVHLDHALGPVVTDHGNTLDIHEDAIASLQQLVNILNQQAGSTAIADPSQFWFHVHAHHSTEPVTLSHDMDLKFTTHHPDYIHMTVEEGSALVYIDSPLGDVVQNQGNQIENLQNELNDLQDAVNQHLNPLESQVDLLGGEIASIQEIFNNYYGDSSDFHPGPLDHATPPLSTEAPNIGDNGDWFVQGTDTGVKAQGPTGPTGVAPEVGENGNWFIGGEDTGKSSKGPTGPTGAAPEVGENGNWFIGDEDTGKTAKGPTGPTGATPEVGENGNWVINDEDTGKSAKGPTGPTGATPEIGENGHWYINEEDTGKTAQGPTGPPGTTSHSELTDRDAPCSHTIDSIANLRCELEALRCEINNRLAIHCTTEDEFWDSYWNGAIADGLYKWQGHKLAFNQYSTNPPERNPHSMCRALDYAETPEYYFLGNRFDDPSKSYVIALSKKDHSIKKIKFPRLNDKRLVYNQIGAGPGTIVLEPSSGYIYASTPGAILSFDSDEPDNDLNYYVNEARAYTNLVFYNTNTNGAFNSIALVTKEEPLTVVDGGVFAVTKVDSNSPVYYLKNGAIVSKTLDTFNNNLKIPVAGSSTDNYRRYFLNAATDYDGNKLYGLQAVMYNGYNSPVEMHFVSIDINGNPEIIPIPVPTNYNIPPAGNNAFERMYCKNGYVYLDLDTYVTVGTTSQPTRLICVYDTRDGSWTFKEIEDARGIEKKDSYASSNTVYSDGSLVYQRIFPNKSDYIKWDYENNTIQILQTKEALEPSRHKKYLQVDGDNNILNAYKADTSYDLDSNILTYDVINPKDLTMYSYAAPSASMVEQYMTVRKDDGSLFGLGFGYGYGYYHRERVIIDPDGDLALDENGVADASDDLDSYVFSAPLLSNNHYLLEEDGNFMYLSGTPECLNSALVFNDTERTISYSYTSCSPYATAVPVIRLDENGYIYFDDHNRFYTLGVEDTEKSATIGCNTILSKSPTLTGQECVENLTSCSDCQSCGSCPSCQGNCLEECVAAQATINEDSNQ